MTKDNDPYKGILIRLLHKPPSHQASASDFDFFSFGYFDGIKIKQKINFLADYFHDQDGSKNSSHGQTYGFEEQHLCLYTPQHGKDYLEVLNPKKGLPLIVITELKFEEQKKIKFVELRKRVAAFLPVDVKWELFHSLGFNDYAVIMRLPKISYLKEIILSLKGMQDDNGKNILRSTYSIAGFRKLPLTSFVDEDIDASIQISLKKADSYDIVATAIWNYLDRNKSDKRNHMIGKYDEEIRVRTKLSTLIGLFYQGKEPALLSPMTNLYNDHINYSNTKLLFESKFVEVNYPLKTNISSKKNPDEELYLAYNFLKSTEKIPGSLLISLERLIHSVSIANKSLISDGSFKTEFFNIMKRLFTYVIIDIGCGSQVNNIFKGRVSKVAQIDKEDFEAFSKSKLDINSLEQSIRFISDLFRSHIQASGRLFESPNFSSKFVGSLKSIFQIYNHIIESSQVLFDPSNPKKVNFFTTVDSTSKISSYVLFPEPSQIDRSKLIPIRLDTESFLNFSFGIPYIIHEIGHHYFAASILESFSAYILKIVINTFFMENGFTDDEKKTVYQNPIHKEMVSECISLTNLSLHEKICEELNRYSADINILKTQKEFLPGILNRVFNEFTRSKEGKPYLEKIFDICLQKVDLLADKYYSSDFESTFWTLKYLGHYSITEKTTENLTHFSNLLKKYLQDFDGQEMISVLEFFEEIYADTFMKQMLNLSEIQYDQLCKDNLRKLGRFQEELPEELMARKIYLYGGIKGHANNDYYAQLFSIKEGETYKNALEVLQTLRKDTRCSNLESIYQDYLKRPQTISRDFWLLENFQERINVKNEVKNEYTL
jgi:hypothetical protein